MSDPRRAKLEATVAAADRAHRDLEACIAGLSDVASAKSTSIDVQGPLDVLCRALEEHFMHEEASPLYRWIPEAFPETRDVLENLKSQHRPILETMATLAELSGADLQRKALELVGRLRSHESAEDALLQRAHQRLNVEEGE